MGMMYYDYEFQSVDNQNRWDCIINNTFENMQLYYRKQLSMLSLLIYFKKAFKITPITLKNSIDDKYYRYKILAIYLLTKYSNEDFEDVAKEFHISLETVYLIASNSAYAKTFQNDIKLFFKQFEDDFLVSQKSSLAFAEKLKNLSQDNLMSKKI